MIIDELTDIVKEYEYGKHELVKHRPILKINKSQKYVTISPFTIIGPDIKTGTCTDLSYSSILRFRKEFKKLFFIIAYGNDSTYFTKEITDGEHYFLIGSENSRMLNAKVRSFNDKKFLGEMKPVVYDPSVKIVAPFVDSGYSVSGIERRTKESESAGLFSEGISYALSIENNDIFGLHVDFDNNEVLSVNIPNKDAMRFSEFLEKHPNSKITPLISYLNEQNPYVKK